MLVSRLFVDRMGQNIYGFSKNRKEPFPKNVCRELNQSTSNTKQLEQNILTY